MTAALTGLRVGSAEEPRGHTAGGGSKGHSMTSHSHCDGSGGGDTGGGSTQKPAVEVALKDFQRDTR